MEQCIRQNNAVDIYEDYFETVDEATQCEKPEAKTVHVFRDPTTAPYKRPISAISWYCLAVLRFNVDFQNINLIIDPKGVMCLLQVLGDSQVRSIGLD
jgi:hypothetical protein